MIIIEGNAVADYPDISIFNFAKDVGITPTQGQANLLQTWYTPSLSYATGKYQEIPDLPKIAWIAVGRRGGTSLMSSLILAHDAIQFVLNWPEKTVNQPYFVLMTLHNDHASYAQPLIKQLVTNFIRKYNTENRQKNVNFPGLEQDSSRDCITIWDNNQPSKKARIIIRPANAHTLRGCAARTVIMDTMAYFREPEEAYYAVRPTIAHDGGRMIIFSTPHKDPKNFFNNRWHAEQKLVLQQEEDLSMQMPGVWNCVVPAVWVHSAPTWVLNPSRSIDEIMKEQLRFGDVALSDFALEFGAIVPK